MRCYYAFFTRPNLLFIEIYVALLFPNFQLFFYQYCVYLQVIGFITLSEGYQRVHISYLSMPIDNRTWQARVGIFNSSKPLLKIKIKNRVMLQFLPHHTVCCLYLFLTFILITQVNNLYQVSSRLIKNIPASFRLSFLKIADITVFVVFYSKFTVLLW